MDNFISSRNNPTVKRLLEIKDKPTADAFLIEGYHLVEMAKEAGCLQEAFGLKAYEVGDVPFTKIGESVLQKLCVSKTPEGILGVASLRRKESQIGDKVLLLDRIQDPGNMGTLLRSALSFGYHDIIVLAGSASPLKAKSIAASQGAIFKLSLRFFDEEEAIDFCAKAGLTMVATALEGAEPLSTFTLPRRHVLCLGNEGRGLSRRLLDVSSRKVKIEMDGIDSLNVGIAGSILMYEFSRR